MDIIKAKLKDIDYLLALANSEGWNPGLNDAIPFYTADPEGFFIGLHNGEPIGCISAVAYDPHYGFMGFYIIESSFRGKGYGMQLWDHALKYLGNRTVGLDGVVAQQENYKKSGFTLHYNNVRYQGNGTTASSHGCNTVSFDQILEYDTAVYGLDRKKFLDPWVRMPNSLTLGKQENGRLKGYGVIRKCNIGYKIGPLFADRLDIARELYQALQQFAGESPLYIDLPAVNEKAQALIQEFQLKPVFQTARMYKGVPPKQELDKVYGVTTFELG